MVPLYRFCASSYRAVYRFVSVLQYDAIKRTHAPTVLLKYINNLYRNACFLSYLALGAHHSKFRYGRNGLSFFYCVITI